MLSDTRVTWWRWLRSMLGTGLGSSEVLKSWTFPHAASIRATRQSNHCHMRGFKRSSEICGGEITAALLETLLQECLGASGVSSHFYNRTLPTAAPTERQIHGDAGWHSPGWWSATLWCSRVGGDEPWYSPRNRSPSTLQISHRPPPEAMCRFSLMTPAL